MENCIINVEKNKHNILFSLYSNCAQQWLTLSKVPVTCLSLKYQKSKKNFIFKKIGIIDHFTSFFHTIGIFSFELGSI